MNVIKRTCGAALLAAVAAVGYGDDAVVCDGAERTVDGSGSVAQDALDLRGEWPVTDYALMDVPYSAVGWDVEENGADGWAVSLELTPAAGGSVSVVASGLTGRGTNVWDAGGVRNGAYVLRHYVRKNGTEDSIETLEARFAFDRSSARPLLTPAAVAETVFPDGGRTCEVAELGGESWTAVGFAGDGIAGSAEGMATVTFTSDEIGAFAFEYTCAAGETLTVTVDDGEPQALAAAADWTAARFAIGDRRAHTVVVSATGGGTAVRGVRWDTGRSSAGTVAQNALDLSAGWTVTDYAPMDVPYSSVGWDVEENGSDAIVSLELTPAAGGTATVLASGLTGRGTNVWDTGSVRNGEYVLRHYARKSGADQPLETLVAYLAFARSSARPLATLAAVAESVFPDDGRTCAATAMDGARWGAVGFAGDGIAGPASGTATVTFALDGIGAFAFEYTCAAGETLTVSVDGGAPQALAAAADWTAARFAIGDCRAHTVVVSATGAGTAVRGVLWDTGRSSAGTVAQHALDLSDVWDKRDLDNEPILWSSLGWEDAAEEEGGKTVTLQIVPLAAGEAQTLGNDLTGHLQTYVWTPDEVTKQVYNIRHVVVGGSSLETDLDAYFSFENCTRIAPNEADMRAAIRFDDGTGWDFGIANDEENWWNPAGGPGEGIVAPEGKSTLTFTVDGHGAFSFAYVLGGGTLTVKVDGVVVRTLDAAAGWSGEELPMDESLVTHKIEFVTELSEGDVAEIGNVRWVDADDRFGEGRVGGGAVDLREGVLVVRSAKWLMPFTWSSTNFTGNALVKDTGFVTIDPSSVASVRVVQVTGEGDDVSQWTEEVEGTAKTLVAEREGEGAVRWKGVRQGVWKAELIIAPPAGEPYRETRILDLRRYIGQGTVFFLK